MKFTKIIIGVIGFLLTFFVSARAVAADNEYEVSSNRTKNPITGTVTEKRKYKNKHKNLDKGTELKDERTETNTYKTDGSVEKKIETEKSEK